MQLEESVESPADPLEERKLQVADRVDLRMLERKGQRVSIYVVQIQDCKVRTGHE